MNTTGSDHAILAWLEPLGTALGYGSRTDWRRLAVLVGELDDLLRACPVGPDLAPGPERSRRLQVIRAQLAERELLDTTSQSASFGVLAQFVCGYHDLDLRDAVGLGHGVLLARYARPAVRQKWIPRLLAGELAGIAITEPHGGSNPAATRTSATIAPDGRWLLAGRKTWISRLTEAAVFVVFFRAPDGELAAAAVDAGTPGLHRQQIPPAGLAGWTWGILDLDAVPIQPSDVLRGDGMALLRSHFASYRPLVTATALGGAAALFDTVATVLIRRHMAGAGRLRDSALETIGRAHAQLTTSLLGTIAAAQLADTGHQHAERWSAEMKAHGIDAAYQAASDLTLLLGASGFQADSQSVKLRRDLNGLLYADGIHDSLYRAAGKQHLRRSNTAAYLPPLLEQLPLTA